MLRSPLLAVPSILALAVVGCDPASFIDPSSDERAPAAIRIDEPQGGVAEQDTVLVKGTLLDAGGAPLPPRALDWASSAASILSVESAGPDGAVLAAHASGSAVITASHEALSASVTMDVAPRPVDLEYVFGTGQAGSAASPLPDSLVVRTIDPRGGPVAGVSIDFRVLGEEGSVSPGSATTALDGRARSAWTLGSARQQRVEARLSSGQERWGALMDSVVVFTATTAALAAVEVSPQSLTLDALGATAPLTARAVDADGAEIEGITFHWTSLDTTVAAVDGSGRVKALATGAVLVVAAAGGFADTCAVSVRQVPTSVVVEPGSLTLKAGETARLEATVLDAGGSAILDESVSWSSSDPAIASVDGSGRVSAAEPGSVVIRAATGEVSGEARIEVREAGPGTFRADQRPYTADSPWNTPIPADAASDARSDSMVATILASSNGRFRSDPTQYSYPIYFADASTPRTTLVCTGIVSINRVDGTRTSVASGQLENVPIPAHAVPSAGSDAQIIVIDTETGDEYDVWRFVPPNGCTNVTRYDEGVHRSAVETSYASRGAGVPYLAGLIRPWEISRGRIDHALAFGYALSREGRCVWPASKTDGNDDLPYAIPEGARLRLDPAVDVESIEGLDETGRIIARALQEYGMYLIDNSGANKIYAEDDLTASWGAQLTATTVNAIPVERIQVLRLPDAYWAEDYQPNHGDCVR